MLALFVMVLCLFINALLAAAEMAFITVKKSLLRELAKKPENEEARIILKLRENPERTLSVVQIGLTLASTLAAAIGGVGAENALGPYLVQYLSLDQDTAELVSVITVILPLTYLNVVLGELVPKALALRHPLLITRKSARWLSFFDSLLSPLVSILAWSTSVITKRILHKQKAEQPQLSQNVELEELSHQTRQYVMNLVSIERMRVLDVYLPWENVNYLDFQQNMSDVEHTLAHSGHTRLPVMRDQEVIGLINAKEFMMLKHSEQTEWQSILRPVVKVQFQDPALKALLKMQEKRSHLSIVYEGQKMLGIVTMEDILEEIIGDVYDEDDDGIIKKLMTHSGKKMLWGKKPPSSMG